MNTFELEELHGKTLKMSVGRDIGYSDTFCVGGRDENGKIYIITNGKTSDKEVIDELQAENKDISAKLALKCTTEWDNGYTKAHEHYLKEIIDLKEVNKRLRNCMNCGNWDIEEMMCGLIESKEVACKANSFKKGRPCGDKWCPIIEGI